MQLTNSVFVVKPANNPSGIVLGKNSNRPSAEVQELIYEQPNTYADGETIKCTYVSVPAGLKHFAVILSKPSWAWGCEMGANDQGVSGCTLPLYSKVEPSKELSLLGIDLLRLALERSSTAAEAVDTIGSLLSEFGQGGSNEDKEDGVAYNNAFIIADPNSVWHMETIGKVWVAKILPPGSQAISCRLSIEADYDKSSAELENFAKDSGFWNGEGKLSWCEVFQTPTEGEDKRIEAENDVLSKVFNESDNFGVKEMMKVLRDKESRICKPASDPFPTAASQVSLLPNKGVCCHWFTATPDPSLSVFKPFIFTPNARVSNHTKSPTDGNRQHNLYRLHAKATESGDNKVISLLQDMEANCLNEVESFILDYQPGQSLAETDDLLKDIVETEVKFY